MDQPNDTLDAQRYRAFRWMMCATEEDQEKAQQFLAPLLGDTGDDPTPALLDTALDHLAAYLATL